MTVSEVSQQVVGSLFARWGGEGESLGRDPVNNNERRYERLLFTLWYCYYDTEDHSQLEIARRLGVSDSLVSDSRKLIEHELKKLKLSVEEGAVFSESLERLLAPAVEVH